MRNNFSDHKNLDEAGSFAFPAGRSQAESFKDRANEKAAQANVRAAVPAVEAYNADNTLTGASRGYAGLTVAKQGPDLILGRP